MSYLTPVKSQRGLTLIELLIVVSIIGILIGIGTISVRAVQRQGRDAQRKTDLEKLASGLEQYFADNGEYPDGCSGVPPVRTCISDSGVDPWIPGLDTYLREGVPVDPINQSGGLGEDRVYIYDVYDSDHQHYHIMTNLENDNDTDRRQFSGPNLDSSPCNESYYFDITGGYRDFPDYDWCTSTP